MPEIEDKTANVVSSAARVRVTEIFYSLQGESRTSSYATTFIRLTGCPLRCEYCDTTYAFKGGEWFSLPEIISEVKKYNTKYIIKFIYNNNSHKTNKGF